MTSTANDRAAAAAPRPRITVPGGAGALVLAAAGLAAFWMFPEDLGLLTRMVTTALFVLSLDLVLGYGGIASLGQAALFGTGAYAAGVAAVHMIADPVLLLVVGAAAGGLMALATGALILRTSGLALLMLTIAVTQILHEIANKARDWTGGSDGLSGIDPAPVLGLFRFDLYGRTSYLFALAVLVLAVLVARRIVRSPFGLACRAVKDDPLRVAALGGSPRRHLVLLYGVAGVFAGTAGALSAVTAGIVGLDSLSFTWSAEALVMLVLGGAGRLHGALIGTVAFMGIHHVLASTDPFHWMLFIGLFLMAVVLFLPGGIASLPQRIGGWLRRRPSPDVEDPR